VTAEDDGDDFESDDDEPDALVEHLFDVIRDLRVRVSVTLPHAGLDLP